VRAAEFVGGVRNARRDTSSKYDKIGDSRMKRELLVHLFVAALGVMGCESSDPNPSGCPTVVSGFETFACNQSDVTSVVLGNDDVFWVNRSTNPSTGDKEGAIMRQSKSGGEPIVLASGRAYACCTALDSDFVYWLERDTTTNTARVMKIPQAGGDPTMVFTGLPKLRQILADHGDVYLVVGDSDLGGYGISRLPAGGSTPEVIVENWKNLFFSNVILDGDYAYVTTGARELWRFPKLGGTPSAVAGGMVEPIYMTAYASNVYITDRSGGTVLGIDESTGVTTKLADTVWLAAEIAVDDQNAYWFEYTNNNPPGTPPPVGFRSVPRAGGSVSTIADIIGKNLLSDPTHLYFTQGKNILRYAK
jgi:hypothetical protein